MSGLFNCGFDEVAAATDLSKHYGFSVITSGGITFPSNAGGGKRMKYGSSDCNIYFALPSPQDSNTVYVGFEFIKELETANSHAVMSIMDNVGNIHLTLTYNHTSRTLEAHTTFYNQTLLAAGSIQLDEGVKYHVECEIKIASSGGIFNCRIEGASNFTYSGNTNIQGNGKFTAISFATHRGSTALSYSYDNIIILNSLGTTNNTWLGPGYVSTLSHPSVDSSIQFTRSGGAANYEMVDEAISAIDDATTKNTSSTVGHTDEFELQDISNVGTVAWLTVMTRTGKDNPGPRQLKPGIKSGATVQETAHNLSEGYSTLRDIYESSDGAGTAFNQTTINSLKVRYNLSA